MKKNIVITGCSSGIGLESAKYLRERFITVYPTAREQKDVDMLKELGFDNAMLLDVREPESIALVIKKVMEIEGRIDVWFNNAGYGQIGTIEDVPTNILREQFETNVFGLHECTRQVVAVMKEQGCYGKIIQHSSVLGIVSLFGRGAYNASKYAVEGLTDTLRLELKNTKIYPVILNTGPITSNFSNTAIKMLQKNIDIENSKYKTRYKNAINGYKKQVPFNEDASAVAHRVHQIILAEIPKPRYYITKATYLLGYLKRLLSTASLDNILRKIG